ncbi:MAG TPA: double-strand break repair protein AddB, partial [Geminicoccaceae bacterium]|nr:double-strand break repair protein AddB [Geminicoccaceae bacterium]
NLACRMRAALEVPGRTAALVTPDRNLARRVAVELQRWGIEVDDSAGTPLDQTPPGGFLLLTAHLIVEGVTPVTLCATLKHPLARGGLEQGRFRRLVRALERAVLRGPRIEGGFRELCAELERYAERERASRPSIAPVRLEELRELCDWFKELARLAHPFEALCGRPDAGRAAELPELLRAHLAFAEALAADEAGSAAALWAREAGEAAARFVEGVFEASRGLDSIPVAAYPALIAVLMAACPVRPRFNRHPRLQILGPLEARLQHADLMLLGGLNEESWPRDSDCGPWLSRPMREAYGLPPVERLIGLAAHDFVQAACAPVVVLSRAEKDESGKPTVPSRWFVRLQAVLEATAGRGARLVPDALWSTCTGRLDLPDGPPRPCRPPDPRPPLEARPRRLSVTQVETWMRDPYGVYARHILSLRPLEPLDAEPGHAERGQVIHRALAAFVRDHPRHLPPNALDRLLAYGQKEFEVYANRPQVMAVWWPRFKRIAEWFLERERERRGRIERVVCEASGQRELPGGFVLTAQADRIELLAGGGIAIIDYRTGRLPSGREVESGMSPRLSLEGVLARVGGFTDLPPGTLRELSYWALLGGERPGIVRDAVPAGRSGDGIDVEELAERALAGLRRLVDHFDDPNTPYYARPRPRYLPGHGDYDHLARVKEWAVEDDA